MRWLSDAFLKDPIKVLLGCGCLALLGFILFSTVLSVLAWWLRGMSTLIVVAALVALLYVVLTRRE